MRCEATNSHACTSRTTLSPPRAALETALERLASLQALELSDSSLGYFGAVHLAAALSSLCTLTHLGFARNEPDNDAGDVLLPPLRKLTALRCLVADGNPSAVPRSLRSARLRPRASTPQCDGRTVAYQ